MKKSTLLIRCGVALLLLYLIGVVPFIQGISVKASDKNTFPNVSCTLTQSGTVQLDLDHSHISSSLKGQLKGFGLDCQQGTTNTNGTSTLLATLSVSDLSNYCRLHGFDSATQFTDPLGHVVFGNTACVPASGPTVPITIDNGSLTFTDACKLKLGNPNVQARLNGHTWECWGTGVLSSTLSSNEAPTSCTLVNLGSASDNTGLNFGSDVPLPLQKSLLNFSLDCSTSQTSGNPTDTDNSGSKFTNGTEVDPTVKTKNGCTDSQTTIDTGEGTFTYHQITIPSKSPKNCVNATWQFSKALSKTTSHTCTFNYYQAPGGDKWATKFTYIGIIPDINNPNAPPDLETSHGGLAWDKNDLSDVQSGSLDMSKVPVVGGSTVQLAKKGATILVGPYFIQHCH